jgi:hypothetical protein
MSAHREASAQLRERGDRGMPYMQVVRSGVFKKLGGEFCAARRPTRSILLVLSNCKDLAREAAFNGCNEMDLPLCGSAFMSHNGSSSQTQP